MSKTILDVEGMSCPSCVEHVSEVLTFRGVSKIEVQLAESVVTIEHEPTVSMGRLIAALENAGYDATPRSSP